MFWIRRKPPLLNSVVSSSIVTVEAVSDLYDRLFRLEKHVLLSAGWTPTDQWYNGWYAPDSAGPMPFGDALIAEMTRPTKKESD